MPRAPIVRREPAAPASAALVGRDDERGRLDAAWHDTLGGNGTLVLIDGPAGFGKTVLAADLIARQAPGVVLRAIAEEDETEVRFGVLAQLLRGWTPRLPPPLAAIESGQRTDADPVAVGGALLALFDETEPEGGLALFVDDIDRADPPSLRALVFAVRRTRRAPVLTLLTCRTEGLAHLPASLRRLIDDVAIRITLAGFSAGDVQTLARVLGQPELGTHDATRVVEHTAGSPLFARAVLDELRRTGTRLGAGVPIPVPAAFAQLVEARLASCSPEAAALTRAASVMSVQRTLDLVGRVAEVRSPLAAVDAAVEAGLLQPLSMDRRLWPEHPLTRRAVYDSMPAQLRAQLHRRAAVELDGIDDDASLRHLVAATVGVDPDLALRVEQRGTAELTARSRSRAASWLHEALRLSPPGIDADRRLTQLVEALVLAADAAAVPDLAAELDRRRDSALGEYLAARLHTLAGDLPAAGRRAERAWRLTGPGTEAELSARIAAELARTTLTMGRAREAGRWAQQAIALAPAESDAALDSRGTLLLAGALAGDLTSALGALAELPPVIAEPSEPELDALVARGLLSVWAGDLRQATTDLETVVSVTRRDGPAHVNLGASAYLSDVYYRLGDWDTAITEADTGIALALDLDHRRTLPMLYAAAANPRSARGQVDSAETYVDAALATAAEIGDFQTRLWATVAAARLAEAKGDPDGVVAALTPLTDPDDLGSCDGTREPGLQLWQCLHATALHAVDRNAEAAESLAEAESLAVDRGLVVAQVAVGRTRGELAAIEGRLDEADAVLSKAATHDAELADVPFDRARLDLARGHVARRLGRRREAGAHLDRALAGFQALGARRWAERAEDELGRCGRRRRPRGPAMPQLTPAEATVAKLVRTGLSNREIATQLLVAVKTVEYHLSNIYAKTGVRSRAQFVARASEPGATPAG